MSRWSERVVTRRFQENLYVPAKDHGPVLPSIRMLTSIRGHITPCPRPRKRVATRYSSTAISRLLSDLHSYTLI